MELLSGYGDLNDEDNLSKGSELEASQSQHQHIAYHRPMCSAPSVALVVKPDQQLKKINDNKQLMTNPKANVVLAPIHGPAHPYKFHRNDDGSKLSGMGHIEETNIEDFTFNEQYQTYQRSGYAIDASTNEVLGDYNEYIQNKGDTAQNVKTKTKRTHSDANPLIGSQPKIPVSDRAVNPDDADLGSEDVSGPWVMEPETANEILQALPTIEEEREREKEGSKLEEPSSEAESKRARLHVHEPDEETEMWEKVAERKMSFIMPPRPQRGSEAVEATSTFHGAELVDYQGRSWVSPPSGVRERERDHDCYIPKKCVRKLSGHSKGVQAIEYFPNTGHLLLSGSMDGKCKIWDTVTDSHVRRTYSGHSEGVRSIHMSNDGLRFVSSGFDRYMQLWDVETGQTIGTYTNRKMGYQVRFYPNDNNIFLMAASDNKIYQWDSRSNSVVQEYNYHLQPCNTVTFFDEGRKFASTSDDKKILVWEYNIPVPIKYIAEPEMHSIPSVSLHPSETAFCGQSMDNTIVVYSCGDKVRQLKKKTFRGHVNSGYACQIGFAPNGKFMISGDGQGKLHVWDWKTTKSYRKFQAHDNGPCMGAQWHPLNPSTVATCGWDGLIKIWD